MKSVQIRSFSGPYFPAFGLSISPYSVRMRENNNSVFGHFSCSARYRLFCPTVKLRKLQRKTNYTWQNENALAAQLVIYITSFQQRVMFLFIFKTMPQVLFLLVKDHALSKVITQIRAFSLNLSTSNQNFKTTKYSLKRSFKKEKENPKKKKKN